VVVWALSKDPRPRAGVVEASAPLLDFGDQDLGRRGPALTVRVQNGKLGPVVVTKAEVRGADRAVFALAQPPGCAPGQTVPAGGSCDLAVTFLPTTRGSRAAELTVSIQGAARPIVVSLRGAGVGKPGLTLETRGLDLGRVEAGKGPVTRKTTVSNPGTAPLSIEKLSIAGRNAKAFQLAQGTDCSVADPVPAHGSCTIAVTYPAETPDRVKAVILLATDVSDERIELRGEATGEPAAEVSSGPVLFGRWEVGSDGATKVVSLRNGGTAPLAVLAVAQTGNDQADFRITGGTCEAGGSLEPGASCSTEILFAPAGVGVREASLLVATNGAEKADEIALRGTGRRPPPPAQTTTEQQPAEPPPPAATGPG
jgi:hypothetical protein